MKDKYGMELAARQWFEEKLKYISAHDLQALYPERNLKNDRLCNVIGLWNELGLPEIQSVRSMKFNEAWDAVLYDNYNPSSLLEDAEEHLKFGKYDAETYSKAVTEIQRKSLKWLRDGNDKNYYNLASTIWDNMDYDLRLKFVADGRVKRIRGADPLSILLDITDPNRHRFQKKDTSDEHIEKEDNEWLLE